MNYLWDTPERMAAYCRELPGDQPVVMLNLLKYRPLADYNGYPEEKPCSGVEAYTRYTQRTLPLVKDKGVKIIFAGNMHAPLIGPDSEQWDDILVVHYPAARILSELFASAAYREIKYHRTAALQDSRLIPMTEPAAFMKMVQGG